MSNSPNHRFLLAQEAFASKLNRPTDTRMLELLECLEGTRSSGLVSYAYDLYSNLEHRVVLDAFLLSHCPQDMIQKTLNIPVDVIETYVYLFMDLDVFRNKLEILSFAKEYPGGPYAKEMMRTAVTVGYEYLLWAYGNPDEDVVDPRFIVRKTMIDAFFRGQAHKGNALTSAMTKEAKAWMNMSVSQAALLEKIDPRTAKAAVNELKIAIEGNDSTVSADNAPVPVEDILH